MRALILMVLASLVAGLGIAQTGEAIPVEEVKARTEAISKTLRCVVCQNQSISDSNAPLAADMRVLVEKRVLAGDSDNEVREYLRVRYGDYVLMSPPLQANTLLLWLGPAVLVLCGLMWFLWRLRYEPKRSERRCEAMSDADRERVRTALSNPSEDESAA